MPESLGIDTQILKFEDGSRGILLTVGENVQIGLDGFWARVLAYRILFLLGERGGMSDTPTES